ncbi:MAG: hypothetical protein ACFFD2_08725 [Promethearchaeota archaeon]
MELRNSERCPIPFLKNWNKIVVKQKNEKTGCIPTAIEWGIRYLAENWGLNVDNIDLNHFQVDFDLDYQAGNEVVKLNNFESVKRAIDQRYPEKYFKLEYREYQKDFIPMKVQIIKEIIFDNKPIIVPIILQREENNSVNNSIPKYIIHSVAVLGFDKQNFFTFTIIIGYQMTDN